VGRGRGADPARGFDSGSGSGMQAKSRIVSGQVRVTCTCTPWGVAGGPDKVVRTTATGRETSEPRLEEYEGRVRPLPTRYLL
jgi:hypothetical protein